MGALPDPCISALEMQQGVQGQALGEHGMGSRGPFLSLGNLSQCLSSGPAGTGARDGEGLEGWRPGRGERETAQPKADWARSN